jgi:glycosyltransferase involved in cell wall biosynthesis
MNIAFLWTGLSGYMNSCLKELSSRNGVELFVSHELPAEEAPFDEEQFAWIPNRLPWRAPLDGEQLDRTLTTFKPDIIVMPSWHIGAYRRIGRKFAGRSWRVMVMDNPWRGSLKQRIGTWISPFYVQPITDVVWLPGERQAMFARKLGFSHSDIIRGSFTCDYTAFAAIHERRIANGMPLPRSFFFVGRMIASKSVDILAESYARYRSRTKDPWPLICCGSGPLRSHLENQRGIYVEGFVQPEAMPEVFGKGGCMIMPSSFEPWSLAVHEGATAGRIILAAENVGAVPHLVQPGYNGFIFDDRDVSGLAALMMRVSAMSDAQLDEMSCASHQLSKQFSPKHWVDVLLRSFECRSEMMH